MRQKLIQQIRNNKIMSSFDENENENKNEDLFINIDSKFITFINNNKTKNNILEIGERFYYWKHMKNSKSDSKYYNLIKYINLKKEMFENNIYSISYRMWDDTFEKANKWKETLRGKQLIAKNYENMCSVFEIPVLSPISVTHLMTVLFYINYEYLQYKFQNKGTKYNKNNNSNSFELLKNNNKEIGNWYKIFTESIILYGEIPQSQKDMIFIIH